MNAISFTCPNNFTQRVISIRSDGKNNNTSPQQFILGSFYNAEIAGAVSPLAGRALAFYNFQYQGSFQENGRLINKIKVIPRSKCERLFRGELYIVEDSWSIHSLDLKTKIEGVDFSLQQVYAPVKPQVWLPVSLQFAVEGSFFGFDFVYEYLATMREYQVQLNPELYVEELQVVDEITEKELAKTLKRAAPEKQQDSTVFKNADKLTRKQLNSLLRAYEKEGQRRQESPEIEYTYNQLKDSGTHTTDSAYWNRIRPVPLTREEKQGYTIADSWQKKNDARLPATPWPL